MATRLAVLSASELESAWTERAEAGQQQLVVVVVLSLCRSHSCVAGWPWRYLAAAPRAATTPLLLICSVVG